MTSPLIHQLLAAGVHFGHQTKRWHPKMRPFIFGSRAGIYIIDLEKTEQRLQAACAFVEEVAAKGQQILYIGTKKQARPILEAEAQRAEMPYVVNRWLGGTLTNFQTIKVNIDRLRQLRAQKAEGFFDRISKKDAKRLGRQLERLEENFCGMAAVDRLPGCVFIVDTKREEIAVREANRLNIPVVAICDTNSDPGLIAHPIPGNDDAIRSLTLLTALITDRVVEGRKRHALAQAPATNGSAAGAEAAPAAEAPQAP
jgi:small subunit ribosomal protein S2